MKRNLFLLCLLVGVLNAAWSQEALNVFAGKCKGYDTKPFVISFAFAQGDTVLFDYRTEKMYQEVSVSSAEFKYVYKATKTDSLVNYKFVVPCKQVYTFKFTGRKLKSRWVEVLIRRIPASAKTRYYNTAVTKQYLPNTRSVILDYDSIVSTAVESKITTVDVFDKYIHQSVAMKESSFQLLAAMAGTKATKQLAFSAPVAPDVPNVRFKYWSYTVSSKLGGAKHWQMAEIGSSVALSFACPAAGAAAGLLMDKMGPQEGGEPSDFFIAMDKHSADVVNRKFGRWDANDKVKLYKLGSMTSIYGISGVEKGFNMVMVNHSLAKAKNIKLEISALYYAPYFRQVNAEEITVTPIIETFRMPIEITTSRTKLVSAQ